FQGRVVIDVQVKNPTQRIWLHGWELNVTSASVSLADGRNIKASYQQLHKDGVARVDLPEEIQPQKARLRFEYDAPFGTTDREGLYRVQHDNEWYAFTQFQAIAARHCFISFDEPSFRATFDISLTVRSKHTALANTPQLEEVKLPDGMKRVRFVTTKKIPTYLVAMAVGPLDVVQAKPIPPNSVRDAPLPLRGVAARGQGHRLTYALNNTGRILKFLEEYVGIPYPFRKLDIVAVPRFGGGAMENVGLITFRETVLMIDEEESSVNQKRAFAYYMAHELAHQWFGNLVTMPWWDDLWLSESFATWLEYRVVEDFDPGYRARVGQVEDVLDAMNEDSMLSTRQIRQPILTSHDIDNAFDEITYNKGGGVLAMFERYLGVERFRRGIRRYLEEFPYQAVNAEGFLSALSTGSGTDVGEPFRTFLNQPGVPLLEAQPSCTDHKATVTLRQSRYLPMGSHSKSSGIWQIPVCMRYGIGSEAYETCELLTERESVMGLSTRGCPDWILPNADGAGYYRWILPPADLRRLKDKAGGKLSTRELLSVGDSLWAGFAKGTVSASAALELAPWFVGHPEREVATIPMQIIRYTRNRLMDIEERRNVERFARDLYTDTYKQLGFSPKEGEGDELRLYRRDLLRFLAQVGRHPEVRKELSRLGRAYVGYQSDGLIHPEAVDTNLISLALTIAVQDGDVDFFETLVSQMNERGIERRVRRRMRRAIAQATDPELAERARNLTLTDRIGSYQKYRLLRNQLRLVENHESGMKWLDKNLDTLLAEIPSDHGGSLVWVTASFCSAEAAASVNRMFRKRIDDLPGGPRNLQGALERINQCAALRRAQRPSAQAFFARLPEANTR
ncbi:MAG: M1 family peptidase, partial [Deltaproteobacteria bacterium]|nr:M1 family peptidase [Deltaproteobacteria bacterium]